LNLRTNQLGRNTKEREIAQAWKIRMFLSGLPTLIGLPAALAACLRTLACWQSQLARSVVSDPTPVLPDDASVMKLLYLSTQHASKNGRYRCITGAQT
jgi:hypothetical protein